LQESFNFVLNFVMLFSEEADDFQLRSDV
jgi:hypothetical protein